MIGRWPLALSLIVGLCAFWSQLGWAHGERWSRQVSNSDWIPLASPRTHTGQSQLTQNGGVPANPHFPQVQPLSLPPALQQQYQQQLVQLQKTQESIQNLLVLQQQLRAQQQLLQAQAFLPNGLNNPEENKQALHQSTFANLQSVSDLAPEVLIPPVPSSDALPPVYPPERFLSQNPSSVRYSSKTKSNVVKSQASQETDQGSQEEESSKDFNAGRDGQYANENDQSERNTPAESGEENEEVQLVYVPAETLAQRSQAKSQRGRSRKQHQNQDQEKSEIESSTTRTATIQQEFARQILQQLHREQLMKNRMVQEERLKEVARLEEEQKELDRQALLHQETVYREQELQRQREAEKQKELERLEEIAKREELERIRELREKQRLEQERQSKLRRQEEMQRQEEIRIRQEHERKMAELQAKEESEREARRKEEERLREIERLAMLQRQKEAEMQEEKEQDKAIGSSSDVVPGRHRAEALVRNPQHQTQHLTETTRQKNRVRGRQRVRGHVSTDSQDPHGAQGSQTSQQPQTSRGPQSPQDNYSSGVTPLPSPNQPPLSVYMGHANMDPKNVKVSDVLKLLKDAKTISVLDSVGPDAPSVFVGPSNLDPPNGFAKFDLPYLSSIENNRVERKVDKLPFFVAPLSFSPPAGYSKIPFPAPHIGSVVVNTVDNELANGATIEETKQESQLEIIDDRIINRHRIRPNPLIEPNSYTAEISGSNAEVTPSTAYSHSTTPTYDTGYSSTTPTSGSRYRYRQFYGDNRPAVKNYESNNQANQQLYSSTTPSSYQEELIDPNYKNHKPYYTEASSATTTPSYSDNISGVQEEATKQQDLAAQLALINQELAQRNYNNPEVQEVATASGNAIENPNRFHSLNQGQILNKFNQNERPDHIDQIPPTGSSQGTRAILTGPTQYTLPAELPVISSHLPGLVNSLLDSERTEHQGVSSTSPPPTSTVATTTTTTEVPTTTQRTRGRQRGRVIATRPTTSTQSPSTRTNTDRPRRPYSRSRSRFTTTTTEGYTESAYQPTKTKTPETTQRHGVQDHTRKSNGSSARGQRYRVRGGEKNTVNSELRAQRPRIVAALSQEAVGYGTTAVADVPQEPSAPALNPNVPVYKTQDDYPSSTPGPSSLENYSSPTESTLNPTVISRGDSTPSRGAESWRGESSQVKNYRQDVNPTEKIPYAGFQSSVNFGQPHLEDNPVNGFNYQAQTMDSLPTSTMSYRPKEHLYDSEKMSSSTETPIRISPDSNPKNYEAAALQGNFGSQSVREYIPREESQASDQGLSYDNNHPNKEEYPQRILSNEPSEEVLSQSTTTTTTTTPVPPTHVIRQRVRGRVGGRVQQDSLIQTHPRDGQDEYVRFNPINQDGPRRRFKTRPRVRSQQAQHQVETDENEYVRIQAPTQYQRSTTTTTTSTTTTTTQQPETDIEYGFIRPPSFQPIHPVVMNYRNYGPTNNQYQEQDAEDTASGEAHPVSAEILRNRQKYQVPPRRPTVKSTTIAPQTVTTPRISSIAAAAAAAENESAFTIRPKIRSEEPKVTRTRSRIRRPGKKRINTTTSSTTENATDDNELPIDENYPRILQSNPETIPRQDNIDRPNHESHGELSPLRNRASGSFQQITPNDNSDDFVINFGGTPNAELAEREEYDQTQLASGRAKNYYQESKGSDTRYPAVTDIEGAESQWSSKLTRSSFQPSYLPNRLVNDELSSDPKDFKGHSTHEEYPEIITAGPEVQSITVLVTAKQGGELQDESTSSNNERKDTLPNPDEKPTKIDTSIEHENISGMEDIFGKKMQDDASGLDTTIPTETTDAIIPTTHLIPTIITDISDNDKTVTEGNINVKKTYLEYPLDRKMLRKDRTRRRRVRVRVRPSAADDFVTAESHRYTSVVNSLGEDRYKYRVEQTSTEKSGQSILDDFFQEMLKTDKTPESSTTVETTFTDVATTTTEPLTTTGTVLLTNTMNDNVEDSENELTTTAAGIILDTEKTDYPKNHRSKWSEVQDLTKHSNLDYSKIASWIPRNANISKGIIVDVQTSTTAPETSEMSKSDVKVLSDYVKAIFETLKEEKTTVDDNGTMTTTERVIPETNKILEKQETEAGINVEEHIGDENNNITGEVKSTTETGATEPMSTFNPTEDTTIAEIVSTTSSVPVPPDEITTEILGTTTTESPLGRILRTSTTTKVSHMTEICYRGRCVMTKPKKEINAR